MMKYREAISAALCNAMEHDPSIFVTGISVEYSSAVFGTLKEARERFPDRVFGSPAMENALTGIAIGAASQGKRPVIVHDRADFTFLAMDQIINLAAKWRYMYGGNAGSVPIVVRMIVGRGWGQGATHSQSLQSVFAHFPGLNVLMPHDPQSARNAILFACSDDRPTIILEHRSLFETEGVVDSNMNYSVGTDLMHVGSDITIVAVSHMAYDAINAASILEGHGISAEIIAPTSIRPLYAEPILASVRKAGRLLVCDTSHEQCGFASEVCATVSEKAFDALKCAPRRLTLPDCPAPVAQSLEEAFYPRASTIARVALEMLGREPPSDLAAADRLDSFKGPY